MLGGPAHLLLEECCARELTTARDTLVQGELEAGSIFAMYRVLYGAKKKIGEENRSSGRLCRKEEGRSQVGMCKKSGRLTSQLGIRFKEKARLDTFN